jgi:hypothetical protein
MNKEENLSKQEDQGKVKKQQRKNKAASAAANQEDLSALSLQEQGMSPAWIRLYAAVRRKVGE